MGVKDKVRTDLDLHKESILGTGVYATERSYPKVHVGVDLIQIWRQYLKQLKNYSAFTNTFQNLNAELEHGFKWQSVTWPWPRQVKLRKRCVLLKGLALRLMWAKY